MERRFTQWRLVEVHPDATAAVSMWRDVPEVVPVEEEIGQDEADGVTEGTPENGATPENTGP